MKKSIVSVAIVASAFSLAVSFGVISVQAQAVVCPAGYTCTIVPCPTGYVCTPVNQPVGCPSGYVCTPTSSGSITVVSPNGGETYAVGPGSSIPFSWQWTGSSAPALPTAYLLDQSGNVVYGESLQFSSAGVQTGSIPYNGMMTSGQYEVLVCSEPIGMNTYSPSSPLPSGIACDMSNSSFTANVSTVVSTAATLTVTDEALQLSYDSKHAESALLATFNVLVNGGTSGVNVYKDGPVVNFVNTTSKISTGPSTGNSITLLNGSVTSAFDSYGRAVFVIPPGKAGRFKVAYSVNPKQMFAGVYYASLYGLSTVNGLDPNNYFTLVSQNTVRTNKVTVIGELSPYLSSVTTPIASGQTMTVNGTRMRGSTLSLDGISQSLAVSMDPNGTVATFVLPMLPDGWHTLAFTSAVNGASNSVGFQVQAGVTPVSNATAKVVGTPTLALSYSSGQKESALTATFNVSVNGGTQGVNIYKTGGGATFTDQNGKITNANSITGAVLTPVSSSISTGVDNKGQLFYIIPAGKTVNFTAVVTANPQQLFAGTYHASLVAIWANSSADINTSFNLQVSSNQTNNVTIIGEVSPYITSVTNPVVPGQTVNVQGQRLATTVMIDGQVLAGVQVGVNVSGTMTSFVAPLSLTVGYHNLQIVNNQGQASNNVSFQVQGGTTTQPSITVLSPNGGETYKPGDTMNIRWNASNFAADTTVGLQLSYVTSAGTFEDGITLSNIPAGVGLYQWVIPSKYGSGYLINQFKMRAILYGSSISGTNPPQDYSDNYFTIASSSASQSLTATCSGNAVSGGNNTVTWSTSVSGGSKSYTYKWSLPGDPVNYLYGGTQTSGVTVVYGSAGTKQASVVVSDGVSSVTANCSALVGTTTTATSLSVSPDPATPISSTLQAGQSSVVLAVIDLHASGGDISINQISIGINPVSSGSLAQNFKIYAGSNLLGSAAALTQTDTQYQNVQWIPVAIPTLTIPNGVTMPITLKADIPSSASGSFRLGIVGLGFVATPPPTSAQFSGFGNQMTVAAGTVSSPSQVDLASVFPTQSTPICPATDYVRTYTVPAFTYPVMISASNKVHLDDYLKINGQSVTPTMNNTYCSGAPRLTSSGDLSAGFTFGSVIPAGTPIRLDLVDTVGVTSGASGVLNILAAPSTPPASALISIDAATPMTGTIQAATATSSFGTPLAVFDISAQGAPVTLKSIGISFMTSGSGSLTNAYLYQGSTQVASAVIVNVPGQVANFTNLNIGIPVGGVMPLRVGVDATGLGQQGFTVSANVNPIAVTLQDGNNNAVVPTGSASGNPITILPANSSVIASNLSVTHGTANTTTGGTTTQQVSFNFSLTAGNAPVYLSNNQGAALSLTPLPTGMSFAAINFSDNDTSGDSANYFFIAPGQTKTFTAVYSATAPTSNGGSMGVTAINYGTSAGSLVSNSLTSSDITNNLRVILFASAAERSNLAAVSSGFDFFSWLKSLLGF